MHLLAAPDKFRGTVTAAEVAAAIAEAATETGCTCRELPLADGGEGLLEAFGGGNRSTEVTGPLGLGVQASWRLDEDGRAIIESAQACGIGLTGGAGTFDPVSATSAGVGELIAAALAEGASRIIVGLGGSAVTDGGFGAVDALRQRFVWPDLRHKVIVCCDVTTRFEQAAAVFGPQKGATGLQVTMLERRLADLVSEYQSRFGTDVSELAGAGAAGGLAGGLAAIGARLTPGFDAIAGALGFHDALAEADLVVTGEGCLDVTSFRGKVVGGVLARAERAGVPALAIVGQIESKGLDPAVLERPDIVSLSELVGQRRAHDHTASSVKLAVLTRLTDLLDLPAEPVRRRRRGRAT